jgi:hypothetical protein
MKDKQKTELILDALKKHFTTWGRGRTNIIFPELRLGSGYCGVAQRRMDLFIISSNEGNSTIGFEIKASRQDFKKDINDDLKQRGARLYCNKFYYVAPKGMIKPEEIPLWAGLWEIDVEDYAQTQDPRFSEPVPAPLMPKAVPSWGLICSMVRHINKDMGTDYVEITNLKNDKYKLKQDIDTQKRLLTDIAKIWTKDMDEHIWWRLMNYRK